MNINAYVKSLKGVTGKDEVLSSLDVVQQDLSTKVVPIVGTAAAAFKTIKPKSEVVIGYEERYRQAFRLGRNASVIEDLRDRLHKVQKNLDILGQEIRKSMPETVSQMSIDHRSAVMMQLVDNAAFMNRFIRKFIEAVTVYETEAVGMYEDYQKDNLTKGEAAWVEDRFPFFLETLEALSDDHFKQKFDDIPNVKVDPDSDDNNALFGRLKMDPFKMGFIPVSLNPFFHIGKWIAEFQAWRYKEAQEDLRRIQQRILLLEEAKQGKSNPQIEKEIKILRDKSEGLIYKINKAEEEMQ
ncbi:putative virion stractural protein [Ralstonia phage RSF1]|uniref:Putative virion stractural protein n=1 Tax=Ralstonia phage RSF1 TaxID=1689679 RepID=A0A0K2QQV5_9CAUD|nr:putative virion stractural protein [Ralstonia phage RSF1]BAS04974.1 putative virion stractural protein [Ralstonia phage RSF1]